MDNLFEELLAINESNLANPRNCIEEVMAALENSQLPVQNHLQVFHEIKDFSIFDDLDTFTEHLIPTHGLGHLILLYCLGQELPNIYKRLSANEHWWHELTNIQNTECKHLSHLLLSELLKCHELSSLELEFFNNNYIQDLLYFVYDNYYSNEVASNAAFLLVV